MARVRQFLPAAERYMPRFDSASNCARVAGASGPFFPALFSSSMRSEASVFDLGGVPVRASGRGACGGGEEGLRGTERESMHESMAAAAASGGRVAWRQRRRAEERLHRTSVAQCVDQGCLTLSDVLVAALVADG